MKKTVATILAIIFAFAVLHTVSAAVPQNHVFAETVSAQAGEAITIPVKMENNSGFMGYAITVRYDPAVFMPVAVQCGTMLNGLFNDSIAVADPGSFTVIYSGTSNCTQDGTLFTMTLDVLQSVYSGSYAVAMSFVQSDTFNESWQDVVLQCEPIAVQVSGTAPSTEPETQTSTATSKEPGSVPTTKPFIPPVTEPAPPQTNKTLSQRMTDWLNGLPVALKYMLWIFVRPLAALIALFE